MGKQRPVSTRGKCGCSAEHPEAELLPLVVAPTESGGKQRNTLRMELVAVACWRMDDTGFAFGSSFLTAETQDDFEALAKLCERHKGAPLSIFGHADPVGDDAFNKRLSGNRAESIYGLLVRDAGIWERLYGGGAAEGWGKKAVVHMLTALGYAAEPDYGKAVREFQSSHGVQPVDGEAGKYTREKLFLAYMDFLCPRVWKRTEFLGRGEDQKGKADYQGCGEFNPVLVFSNDEADYYQKSENRKERDGENSVNRRVVVYLFRPGTTAPGAKWPCPRVDEGVEGCRKRLWSDGNRRRSTSEARREYGETGDTFACRFYHRLAETSPCEGVEAKYVELIVPLEQDIDGNPFHLDLVRLRQLDGEYVAELMEGDEHVKRDGKNPLNYFHFQMVPPGLYCIDVAMNGTWHTILRGLRVTTGGAYFGDDSFEVAGEGEKLGRPEEMPAGELLDESEPDLGCC